ncbi:hypothetical protein CC1G_04774 [Coprinopsis cinerea okayama7|uniref:Uncharacterized protein n=1 Tax=Coprinopsis cinerea (strain Okayama-7 / 130 / ATCC MYA-4618 / FGSC 9003) TaxID=240176 RepID=A8P2I6_COPC7|nr:hypothetical protein CC1G_04774 [Coprinopsis cinerea okayama7\|eukprot:XP_001838330.2 hypothetical protein CC1G_04774 [Coprinopsis cinerea okayama7\
MSESNNLHEQTQPGVSVNEQPTQADAAPKNKDDRLHLHDSVIEQTAEVYGLDYLGPGFDPSTMPPTSTGGITLHHSHIRGNAKVTGGSHYAESLGSIQAKEQAKLAAIQTQATAKVNEKWAEGLISLTAAGKMSPDELIQALAQMKQSNEGTPAFMGGMPAANGFVHPGVMAMHPGVPNGFFNPPFMAGAPAAIQYAHQHPQILNSSQVGAQGMQGLQCQTGTATPMQNSPVSGGHPNAPTTFSWSVSASSQESSHTPSNHSSPLDSSPPPYSKENSTDPKVNQDIPTHAVPNLECVGKVVQSALQRLDISDTKSGHGPSVAMGGPDVSTVAVAGRM